MNKRLIKRGEARDMLSNTDSLYRSDNAHASVLLPLLTATVLGFTIGDCESYALSVSISSPSNVLELVAGRPFQVDVNLSELEAGEQLETLEVSVDFDAALLQPISVSAGAILPDPLDDPLDFFTSLGTRDVTVTFLTLGEDSPDRIGSNGPFFSVGFMPLVTDSQGELSLTLGEVQQFNPIEPEEPLFPDLMLGEPLTFAVSDAPRAIPGDYDFDTNVDGSDFLVWQQESGATGPSDADGNGDGVVNAIDYTVWRDNFGVGRPADYDRDGDIDGADFLKWQRDFGQSVEPFAGADGNGNGIVEAADYTIWRDSFGLGAPVQTAGSAAVPEPSSLAIAILIFLFGSRAVFGQKQPVDIN